MVAHIFDLFNKHRKYIWQNMILVYENTLRKLGTEGNFGSNSKESAGNAGVPVQLLGQEDLLEKEWLTIHSSMVAWRIPWRGGWQVTVQSVPKSQTRLGD